MRTLLALAAHSAALAGRRATALLAALALLTALAAPAPVLAEATATTDRITIPIVDVFANPCTGESLTVTGELLLIFHTTMDASGGVHVHATVAPLPLRGDGATGTQYIAVGGDRRIANATGNGAGMYAETEELLFVSQGGTDNFLGTLKLHFTVNANGERTALVDSITTKCVG